MKLTSATITKDEPQYIEGCILSVSNFDEIVVLDTGSKELYLDESKSKYPQFKEYVSTDKTEFMTEGLFDFSKARNTIADYCTGDYVLAIDTDERLVDNGLKEFIEKTNVEGYAIHIKSPHIQFSPLSIVAESLFTRIYKNGMGFYYINPVHENVIHSIASKGGRVKEIPKSVAYLAHLGYDISQEEMLRKMKRNMQLAMMILKKNPGDSYTWFSVARSFAILQQYNEFEMALTYALKLGMMSPLRERAIRYLMEYQQKKNKLNHQENFYTQFYGKN